jgi:galactokinase/mevalonate kinase-like predicted kinase
VIIATAPGRCGIVGNPTDMYGGSVISISTRERARCDLAPADALEIYSSGERAVLRSRNDLALRHDKLDVARAALTYFVIDPASARFSLKLTTEIPMQAGMAGSTALVVAIVGAMNRYFGWKMHPWAIAETARKIENRIMGVVCGFQDQHMAVFGGLNYMDFAGKESLEQRDDEPLATIEPLHDYLPLLPVPFLLAHTGIRHHSGSVHKSPRERWLAGEKLVVDTYRRIAELARSGKRAWLARDWPALGALMNENHALVANLGGSGPANDRLIEAARAAGAYGAKLAGAGGGGTIIALTDDPIRLGRALMEAGADSLMTPEPSPGLIVMEEQP